MIAQVTTGFTSAGDLLIPGASCRVISIQNNGTGAWRMAFGSDTPTTSTGRILAAGSEFTMTLGPNGTGPRPIRAIFGGSGSQLLDIITDDKDSTAPAHA